MNVDPWPTNPAPPPPPSPELEKANELSTFTTPQDAPTRTPPGATVAGVMAKGTFAEDAEFRSAIVDIFAHDVALAHTITLAHVEMLVAAARRAYAGNGP